MRQKNPWQTSLSKLCILAFLMVSLFSCSVNFIYTENVLVKNRENLGRLSIGMTKDEVVSIMGSETVKTLEQLIINSPYRVETLKDNNDQNLEILFFYTDEKRDVNKISDDELTPVVLKDGKVQGWGRTFLADIAPSYRVRYNY